MAGALAFACLVAVWALSSLDCLTETPTTAVSVFAPFVARRFCGRAAAWLLAPGWPSGLLFYLLTGSLVFAGWAGLWEFWQPDAEDFLAAGNVAGCALAPLALALVCFRRQPRLLGPFVVCALILVIFGSLIMFMTEVSNEDDVAFLGIVSPPSALMSAAVAGILSRKQSSPAGSSLPQPVSRPSCSMPCRITGQCAP